MNGKRSPFVAAALIASAGLAVTSANAERYQRIVGDQQPEHQYSVANTRDGGYITAGYRRNIGTGEDFHIVKHAPDGSVMWEREYVGDGSDIAYSVQQTPDGGYIIAGESTSFSSAGGLSIVLLKLSPAGLFGWANVYEGTVGTDPIHTPFPGVALDQTPDEGFVVVGNWFGLPTMFRTDSGGALIYQNVYTVAPLGGPNSQAHFAFTDVEYDEQFDKIVVSGTVRDRFANAAGVVRTEQDAFLFNIAATSGFPGPFIQYDSPDDLDSPNEPNVWETGDGLDQLPNGEIVLAGRTNFGTDSGAGTHLVFTDPFLAPIWTANYATFGDAGRVETETAYAAVEFDRGRQSIIQTGRVLDGNFSNAHQQRTDLGGAPIWGYRYGDQFRTLGESIQPRENCGAIMTGRFEGFAGGPGFGGGDIYLVKNNTRGESGCFEKRLDVDIVGQLRPRERQVGFDNIGQFFELQNFLRASDSGDNILCFKDTCADPCSRADIAEPFGVLNIDDVLAFLAAFAAMDPIADIAPPAGTWNIDDVLLFLDLFARGCP